MAKLPSSGFILCRKRLPFLNNRFRCKLYSTNTTSTDLSSGPELSKTYDLSASESAALKKWKNIDKLRNADDGAVFRMLLPPPNVTGKLHLGHFLTLAVEDTISRWKLMTGAGVEWIPGFDHAGIATQSVVNRKLASQQGLNKSEHSDMHQSIVDFSSTNLQSIKSQLEKCGALLDWDKPYYTLDEKHSSVVKEAFVQLFESGLIRRCDGLVNWSCALQTSIADIEIDEVDFDKRFAMKVPNYKESVEFGVLYYVEYRLVDSDKKLIVATSRPETMFGDVALAVNPDDARYTEYVGKQVVNPVNGATMPIITDRLVKPDFGSGIVKVTPAHDKLDFTIGSANDLSSKTIFTPDGKLNEFGGNFQGMPRFSARRKVIELLRENNVLIDEESYQGSIDVCSRTGDVVEPRIIPHWFLQTQFLSNKLVQAICDKTFMIVPENHSRSLLHKITTSQDWCLSRQIKWGHQIPAFHHIDHPEKWVAARDAKSAIAKLEHILKIKMSEEQIVQDLDVLDTWFSSALIPLAVSGWPDAETYKEIALMETGNDILLFWVWRMTILTLALIDRFPFRSVLLHGIVTDAYGRKMSKSKGNVIDPMHIIEGISYENLLNEAKTSYMSGELDEKEYILRKNSLEENHSKGFPPCGNDALRLTLLSQNILDEQITLDLVYLDNCRRFTNKLWQALRFFKFHNAATAENSKTDADVTSAATEFGCKWILSCLYEFNKTCETSLNQANFHLYAEAIRKFFYLELCDVYIELIKGEVNSGADITKFTKIMEYVLQVGVKLAHPLIPFVTEEIWSHLRNDQTTSILQQDFPSSKDLEQFYDPSLIDSMDKAMQITREIRSVKQRSGWTSKTTPLVYLEADKVVLDTVQGIKQYMAKLSSSRIEFGRFPADQRGSYGSYLVDVAGNICRIHIPMVNEARRTIEEVKLEKLKLKLLKLKQQFENPSFQQNAPEAVKEKLKKKVETLILQIQESASASDSNQKPNPPS